MTKPSEWTRYEAWNEAIKRCRMEAKTRHNNDGGAMIAWVVIPDLPFPPDPVERVSDEDVKWYANPRNVPDANINNMAEEVLASRAKDNQK